MKIGELFPPRGVPVVDHIDGGGAVYIDPNPNPKKLTFEHYVSDLFPLVEAPYLEEPYFPRLGQFSMCELRVLKNAINAMYGTKNLAFTHDQLACQTRMYSEIMHEIIRRKKL